MLTRRTIVSGFSASIALAASGTVLSSAASRSQTLPIPKSRKIKVAFLVGEWANLMDVAGPWEVFVTAFKSEQMGVDPAFELFTVGSIPEVNLGGIKARPDYQLADAPQPDVIIVPAYGSTPESIEWLQQKSANSAMTAAICVGAFGLAEAGLLDGLSATTHHDFFTGFERKFPNVSLKRGVRFVDNGRMATAGGLTSGIDIALHIVGRYLGTQKAKSIADYLEHQSDGWRDPSLGWKAG